jgi:hypothetical protein
MSGKGGGLKNPIVVFILSTTLICLAGLALSVARAWNNAQMGASEFPPSIVYFANPPYNL